MPQLFTIDQANRTLPLTSRIVADIVRTYALWREAVDACEVAAASVDPARHSEGEELQRRAQALAGEIESLVAELGSLGIELKGFDDGLVDFPSEVGGQPIYLCWRLGEPRVAHWHEPEAGFAGRQPIETLSAAAVGHSSNNNE